MINKDRVVEKFLKYVQINSESRNEVEFAKLMMEELMDLGFEVEMDNTGEIVGGNSGNLIAKLLGTNDKEPVLFSCHMDTVTPGINIKPIIKDEVIYSDGTTILGGDDKAGIAAILEAVKTIKENKIDHRTIEIFFSVCEEGGLFGAKNLDYTKIKSRIAFVLDSGGKPGQIVVKGPAQDKISAKVIGKPAHAGVCPEQGISAIQVAAEAITNMKLLRIDEETTANIGSINGGGATNIVCPEIEIKAEARSLNSEKLDIQTAHMVKCFKDAAKKFNTTVEVDTERMYGPFVIDENDELVNMAKSACAKIGLEAFTASTGGGSDTNILNCNGVKAVNLGIGERKPHTLEEHLAIVDLVNTSKLVLELMR
ncbi:MAG: M20/M25/M40 family metallo-hydrolase [Clostridium sp.]